MRYTRYLITLLLSLMPMLSFANSPCIYCAGPLFNDAERAEMNQIALALEQSGFRTFLPHRDGIEGYKLNTYMQSLGYDANKTKNMIDRAIFALDTYQVLLHCDAVVANLRDRDNFPDDGTISEASMAWAHHKPLIFYKDGDPNATLKNINALVYGLSNFETLDQIADIPESVKTKLAKHTSATPNRESLAPIILKGEALWSFIQQHNDKPETERLAAIAEHVLTTFA